MPFEPKSGEHAIVEAVFGLVFSRRFKPTEIDSIISNHDKWRADLPRVGRSGGVIQFAFGEGEPAPMQLPSPAAGVIFDALRKDGSLDWRLRVDENFMYVNCLSYTGWDDVFGKAKRYFSDAIRAAFGESPIDPRITAAIIQYIDVFEWKGKPEEYDVDQLFCTDNFYVPPALRKRGPLWHLHQGWYRDGDLVIDGRMLERINVDAAIEQATNVAAVKMDTFHRLEFKESVLIDELLPTQMSDRIFGWLHDQDKAVVRAYLTKEMRKRIGLDD